MEVRLLVAGGERFRFWMDEDVGCWRHRTFKNIEVSRGDGITVVAEAEKEEQAILDYLECMPSES